MKEKNYNLRRKILNYIFAGSLIFTLSSGISFCYHVNNDPSYPEYRRLLIQKDYLRGRISSLKNIIETGGLDTSVINGYKKVIKEYETKISEIDGNHRFAEKDKSVESVYSNFFLFVGGLASSVFSGFKRRKYSKK